ncbi:MAG: sarcosine oxidase subunit delta [Hyphomonadaceae bacterium]|nr:sarcosine oxidase subunit delta [Hyphomonadaceae bacterium]
MIQIHCPYCCELLPEQEFAYAGEAHIVRPEDPGALSDEAWRDYLFLRTNARGPYHERWRHVHGCSRFFNALRDTVSDRILVTYRMGEAPPAPPSEEGGDA